jgi:predicted Ser/Thr protein kinase
VTALWAVLSRLKPPQAESFPKNLQKLMGALTPLEKAELHATGKVPGHFDAESRRLFEANLHLVIEEFQSSLEYEGLRGASAREIKTALFNAAQDKNFPCLSPLAIVEELRRLLREDTSTYDFLQRRPTSGYYDYESFLDVVLARYIDKADAEVRTSLGLVEEGQYEELFARYIYHISHWVKGEKLLNRITGDFENPDVSLMRDIEQILKVEGDKDAFRRLLISRIGAWSLDHPQEPVSYALLFPHYLELVEREFFAQKTKQIRRALLSILALASGEIESDRSLEVQARRALERLCSSFGYCNACARETVAYLLKKRYPS